MAQTDDDIATGLLAIEDVRIVLPLLLVAFGPVVAGGIASGLTLAFEGLVGLRAARARGDEVAEEVRIRLRDLATETLQTLAAARFGSMPGGTGGEE